MQIPTIEPEWISEEEAIAIHSRQLAEHGGGDGVRDIGLLQSAMARPQNAFHYNQVVSLAKLAACYGYGIAKNCPFVSGNTGTALICSFLFLKMNGFKINAGRADKFFVFYDVAQGHFSEEQLADWLESKLYQLA